MMKRFLCTLWLLTGVFGAAADTAAPSPAALSGNFAAALEISSEPVRQTALLKLLADSAHEEAMNCAVYGLLVAEFEEKEPDKMVREQLAQLYREHPADLLIVSLYADYGEVKNKRETLEKALTEIVPPAPQDARAFGYLQLVENAMEGITEEGDPLENAWQEKVFEARLALLDRVIANQKKESFALAALRLDLLRKAIYFCDDLVPEQKQFNELPADHRRKKLYEETLAQWKKFLFAKDKAVFLKQFAAAIALGLPECDQFAAEAVRRYGVMDEEIQKLITESALKRSKYANFRPCAGNNPFADTLVALGCKDFEAAERAAAKSLLLKRLVALSKAAETGDKAAVKRILAQKTALTSVEFQTILQMIEVTRDVPLYWEVRKRILAQSKAEELRNDLANSLGYVAVALNVDLELAAKLLERVYAEEKTSAYTDSLAMLRLRQKRYDEAAKLIREAFMLREPGEAASVFLLHAAQITAAKDDKVLARKLLERAKKSVRPEDFEYDREVEKQLTEMLK